MDRGRLDRDIKSSSNWTCEFAFPYHQFWHGGSFMMSLCVFDMAMNVLFFPHCLVAEGHRQGSLAR